MSFPSACWMSYLGTNMASLSTHNLLHQCNSTGIIFSSSQSVINNHQPTMSQKFTTRHISANLQKKPITHHRAYISNILVVIIIILMSFSVQIISTEETSRECYDRCGCDMKRVDLRIKCFTECLARCLN